MVYKEQIIKNQSGPHRRWSISGIVIILDFKATIVINRNRQKRFLTEFRCDVLDYYTYKINNFFNSSMGTKITTFIKLIHRFIISINSLKVG